MKVLSLLFSLLLGAAVLLFFVQPWDKLERMMGSTGARETSHAKPPAMGDSTGAVEQAPEKTAENPKPAETALLPPAATPAEPKAENQKTTLLANEKAEAERSAALQQKAATPPQRETKRYFKVTVRDNATLEAGLLPANKVVIRLEGIAALSPDETCKKESGAAWPCGAQARAALIQLIRYRAVTCTLPPGGETKDFDARCSVMDQDLSTWLVRRGWAAPQAGNEEYAKALDAARSNGLGLWQVE